MEKNEAMKTKLLFNFALIAYTSFLCFYLILFIVGIFNDKDLTVSIPIIAAFCGLFPVAFISGFYVGSLLCWCFCSISLFSVFYITTGPTSS